MKYGYRRVVEIGFEEALEKVEGELKKEGFGVLTEIDVKTTMKLKLDVDFRKYVILGACNPTFAYKALLAEMDIGLLLPCNVILYESDDGKTVVAAIDPVAAMGAVADNPELEPLAHEVRERLIRAIDRV
jgi:uncharacterized protein (DUF302 family)